MCISSQTRLLNGIELCAIPEEMQLFMDSMVLQLMIHHENMPI